MKLSKIILIATFLTTATVLTIYALSSSVQVPSSSKMQLKPTPEEIPTVDFCELLLNPELYDKKIVRTKALYVRAMEVSMLLESKCDSFDINQKISKPSERVWVDFISYDFDELKGTSYSELKENVTVIGRFDGKPTCDDCKHFNGYGHMNGYKYQF